MTGLLFFDSTVISTRVVHLALKGLFVNTELFSLTVMFWANTHGQDYWFICVNNGEICQKKNLPLLFLVFFFTFLFSTTYLHSCRTHVSSRLFSMNVICCVIFLNVCTVHCTHSQGYRPDRIRFWPRTDPPRSRSRHQIWVPVGVRQCVPPLACSVRTAAKKRERRVQNMISSITHGVGG